ncbi:MAG TPA: AAA family ATPase, partial [Polyangia bacterium]
ALHDAFATARSGRAVVQFVQGSSGMGKSALVRRFLDDLEAHGAVVLTGRCYERESVPYKALDSLIDALSQHLANLPRLEAEALMPRDIAALARIFPALRQVEAVAAAPRRTFESPDPVELRRRAFNALREMLARLADRKPLVIAIDDLQWGDVDSAAVVAAVLRPPDSPSVLWVASCRAEDREASPFLRELHDQLDVHAGDFREVSVGPLSQLEARDLALALIGTNDADARAQAEHIAREAGGNPFFIGELARHVREGEEQAPELLSLGDVLHARLRRLPADARRLLDTLAVAGRPILRSVALRAAEVHDATALAVLKAANLARTSGGENMVVECYHDRIREAAFAQLGADDVRFVHRRLGIAIEASARPDNEALAIHFREAGERDRAAEFAIQAAARAAASLAFDRAAWLDRFALELDPPESVAQTLRVRLGDALANAGRGGEAGEAYLAAAAKGPAGEALELKRRAAAQLLFSGHLAAGTEVIENVLGQLGMKLPPTPARALSSLLWQRARIRLRGLRFRERSEGQLTAEQLMRIDVASAVSSGLGMVDIIRAAAFQARELLLALDAGEPRRLVRALTAEAGFVSIGGVRTAARSARVLKELDALARHVGTPEALGMRAGGRGMVAFQEGRWAEALAESTEAEQIFRDRCTGYTWEQNLTQIFAVFALALLGRIRELTHQVARLIKEARERGDLWTEANLLCAVGYYGALAADQPDLARAQIAEGLARWNVSDAVQLPHFNAVMSEIVIDLYANDPVRAWERLAERQQAFKQAQLLRGQALRISVLYSRTRAAVGRAIAGERDYLRSALADARALDREGVAYASAQAALARGEAALVQGSDRAAALLEEAERRYAACDQAMYVASIRWIRGKLVGGEAGAQLVARAEDFAAGEGIRHPMRMFSTLAPSARLFDPARPQPPEPLRGRGIP